MTRREGAPRRRGMVRNVIHLGLGQAATTILTILTTAMMARTLGPSEFGLLYLLMSIASFAYVVVEWGHAPFIIRETARHPDRTGNLIGSALAVRSVAALLACAIAVATTWLLGYDVRTRLLTGALILAWLPLYHALSLGWAFRGHQRMDCDAFLNVVLKVAVLVGSIACFALGGRLIGLVLMWLVTGSLTMAVGFAVYQRLRLPAISASISTARQLMHDGVPLFAMSLAVAIEPFINANILYKMTTSEAVGWYGAAWNIAGTLLAPATILGTTMYPRLSMAAGDATEFKRSFKSSFRPLLMFAVLGAVGTYLFADVPVRLIYSLQKFGPAVDILRASAPVLMLMYIDIYLAMSIVAAGKAGRLASAKVALVFLTTGLVLVLVPLCQARYANGGLGVMYAMAIGEMLMLVVAGILIREAVDGRTISDVCRSLLAGAVTVLLFRLLPALTPFLAIPMCILVFGGLSLLVGAVKRSDVEMLLALLRKPSPVPRL